MITPSWSQVVIWPHQHQCPTWNALYRLAGWDKPSVFQTWRFEAVSSGARELILILNLPNAFGRPQCNDRIRSARAIQRGFSYFVSARSHGSHIGPDKSHTPAEFNDVAFSERARAAVGHLGIDGICLRHEAQKRRLRTVVSLQTASAILHKGNNWRFTERDGRAQTQWAIEPRGYARFGVLQSACHGKTSANLAGAFNRNLLTERTIEWWCWTQPLPGHLWKPCCMVEKRPCFGTVRAESGWACNYLF